LHLSNELVKVFRRIEEEEEKETQDHPLRGAGSARLGAVLTGPFG
jgi:hypothetical protein